MSIKSQELIVNGIELQIKTFKNQIEVLQNQLLEEKENLLKEKYFDYISHVSNKEIVSLFENGIFYQFDGCFYYAIEQDYYGQLWAKYEWRKREKLPSCLQERIGINKYHYQLLVDYREGDKDASRNLETLLNILKDRKQCN